MSKPNIKGDLKTIELTGSIRVRYCTLSIYLALDFTSKKGPRVQGVKFFKPREKGQKFHEIS
jgi:hypothetical protein